MVGTVTPGSRTIFSAVGRVQFGCQRNFLNSIISKLDKHVVLLLINYIAGQLIQIFQRVTDLKYCTLEPLLKQKHTARSKKGSFLMVSFNLFFANKQMQNKYYPFILWHFESTFNDLNDTVLQLKTAISSSKKTKQQRKNLIYVNTKTIQNKHFIHYLKRLPQTSSVCFCNANI